MVNLTIMKHWEITDKDGKLVKRTPDEEGHSFCIAFAQHLEACMSHTFNGSMGTYTVKDTGNTNRNIYATSAPVQQCFSAAAISGVTTYGMQLGTGTTTPTINDYTIQTLIAHGTSTGQLSYGATMISATRVEGTSAKVLIQRAFTNNSGGSITARESSLVVASVVSAGQYNFLAIHEAENQEIQNGQTGTLFYDLVMTN